MIDEFGGCSKTSQVGLVYQQFVVHSNNFNIKVVIKHKKKILHPNLLA